MATGAMRGRTKVRATALRRLAEGSGLPVPQCTPVVVPVGQRKGTEGRAAVSVDTGDPPLLCSEGRGPPLPPHLCCKNSNLLKLPEVT